MSLRTPTPIRCPSSVRFRKTVRVVSVLRVSLKLSTRHPWPLLVLKTRTRLLNSAIPLLLSSRTELCPLPSLRINLFVCIYNMLLSTMLSSRPPCRRCRSPKKKSLMTSSVKVLTDRCLGNKSTVTVILTVFTNSVELN